MKERKTFTFDGENSADYGLYISGDSVYNAPNREIDMVSIPGRNGQLAIDMGRYENITVTYPAFVFADTQEEFREKIRRIRNWLCSKTSYQRLTDEYNPESFRLGLYKSGLEVEPIFYNRCGEFEMSFDCKPQRFLFTGEEVFTLGEWGETETYSGAIVSFEGTETTAIKTLNASIVPKQNLNGQSNPYPPGGGVNKWDEEWEVGNIDSQGNNSTATDRIRSKNYVPVIPNTQYYIKSPSGLYIWGYDSNKTYIGRVPSGTLANGVITIPNNCYYIRFIPDYPSYGTTYKNDISINYPSTDHDYHPYSNICPISGTDTVNAYLRNSNFLPISVQTTTRNGITFTVNDDGSIKVNGTATANVIFTIGQYVLPNTSTAQTYVLKGCPSGGSTSTYYLDCRGDNNAQIIDTGSGRAFISNGQSGKNADIIILNGVTVNNLVFYPRIVLATDTSDFQKGVGNTYPISLGQTVYGGTHGIVSGKLTITHGRIDLGSLNYSKTTSYARPVFYKELAGAKTGVENVKPNA